LIADSEGDSDNEGENEGGEGEGDNDIAGVNTGEEGGDRDEQSGLKMKGQVNAITLLSWTATIELTIKNCRRRTGRQRCTLLERAKADFCRSEQEVPRSVLMGMGVHRFRIPRRPPLTLSQRTTLSYRSSQEAPPLFQPPRQQE